MEHWREDFDRSISSFPDNRAEGAEACERLLASPFLPPSIEEFARGNATWYAPSLDMHFPWWDIQPPADLETGWSLFNPSIFAADGSKHAMVVRSSNYRIEESGRYVVDDPDGVIRTHNYAAVVEDDGVFAPLVHYLSRIDTSQVEPFHPQYCVQGLEDARLYTLDGQLHMSVTVRDRHPEGICQIARVPLGIANDDGKTIVAQDLTILSPPIRHEKNWMPTPSGGFIYSVSPTVVVNAWGKKGKWRPAPPILRHSRGGTQVVRIAGGHLALVHEATDHEKPPRRVYTHRWVFWGNDWNITSVSAPFCFHGRGIEFAAGLARSDDGTHPGLMVSYGVGDASARLMRIPWSDIATMLQPVDIWEQL